MDENTGAQPFRVGPFGPWDLLNQSQGEMCRKMR